MTVERPIHDNPEWPNEDFLGYCTLHSATPRALYHAKHIRRLLELAGEYVQADALKDSQGFYAMHSEEADPLIKKAWKRLKAA
jgi:hypothetical protein